MGASSLPPLLFLSTCYLSLAFNPFFIFFFPHLLFGFKSNMLEIEEKENRNGSTKNLSLKEQLLENNLISA